MPRTARALLPLAVFFLLSGCGTAPTPKTASNVATELAPSPNLYVGRILAIDLERRFSFSVGPLDRCGRAGSYGATTRARRGRRAG